MLKIYNSLTKQKEIFTPIHPGEIRMYVCGITAYDYSHIGHARSYILFDMIVRYLRLSDYKVNSVRNITDIEDKIIKRAQEAGISCDELTEKFISAWHEDEKKLGILPPDEEPRATQYIPQIIELIKKLIDNQHAYVAENGDIYFDVRSFKDYGKLAHRKIDDLIAGARVEVNENKKDPLDFVLWKIAKAGEPHWPSPWGDGRPGWHIECSAMSSELLGQPFDIHGGGLDLKFPHHENEIAQSEAACNKQFAKLWMHAGLLMVNNEKMSKSLNNFFTIREVLAEYDPETLRYFMLASHYRSPVNYSKDNMSNALDSLSRLYLAVRGLPDVEENNSAPYENYFKKAMDDDFNTPEALAVLFEMAREINIKRNQNEIEPAAQMAKVLKRLAKNFGILQQDPELFLKSQISQAEIAKIDALIAARKQARVEKNWGEADRIRQELTALDVVIEDGADGTVWRKGRIQDERMKG